MVDKDSHCIDELEADIDELEDCIDELELLAIAYTETDPLLTIAAVIAGTEKT